MVNLTNSKQFTAIGFENCASSHQKKYTPKEMYFIIYEKLKDIKLLTDGLYFALKK